MKRLMALVLLIACASGARLEAETAAATPKAVAVAPAKRPKKHEPLQKENQSPANKLFGQSATGLDSNETMTTEIYADEAFFDSAKNMGIFSGRVKVTDPRFNLQAEKLTVFITKGENQGLEKAIAEGNVGVVRDRPDPNGGSPTRAVGRADKATYVAATGNVELRGTPRVQEGPNMHVATSPDTVMIINQNSQLTTHGPSRTEIRQQSKEEEIKEKKEKKAEARKAEAQVAPTQSVPAAPLPTP
jgi:lipopolysaccharide transport protein LptA